MIINYDKFINENKSDEDLSEFIYSKEFGDVLAKIKHDDVAKEMVMSYDNLKSKYTYIDVTDKTGIVTFLYSTVVNDLEEDEDPWDNAQRQEIKIGKLTNKLFKERYDETIIEEFINRYKSVIRENSTYFDVVSGDNIKKYYSEEYTNSSGVLGNSCMRYDRCQNYLELYSDNPERVSLLVLFEKGKEKAIGRALLWKLNSHRNTFLMDRIYTAKDSDRYQFKRFAATNDMYLSEFDDKERGLSDAVVILKNKKYEFYPHLDTLHIHQPSTGILTDKLSNTDPLEDTYILDGIYGDSRLYKRKI